MVKLNFKENKQFFLPGLVLILILLVSLFFLKPQVGMIIKARQVFSTERKTLAELTKKLAGLEGLAKVELSEKVNLVLEVLPAEKDVPVTLFVLKKLTLDNGANLDEFNIAEVGEIATDSAQTKIGKGEILPSLSFKVSLTGEQQNLINFLNQMESTAPLMGVSQITISQKQGELPEAKAEIKAFFLPLPQTLGKVEQPISAITTQEEKVFGELNEFQSFKTDQVFPALPGGKENPFE